MTVGVYGQGRFTRFSALGPQVEFANRLCGANRAYRADILAAAATFQEASEAMEFRPIDLLEDEEGGPVTEIYQLLAAARMSAR